MTTTRKVSFSQLTLTPSEGLKDHAVKFGLKWRTTCKCFNIWRVNLLLINSLANNVD